MGIDVTNLRGGGGVTHIIELLAAANPFAHGFSKIIIWGGSQTLDKLPQRAWLKKVNPPALNKGLISSFTLAEIFFKCCSACRKL